jgi:peptidoglycan/LPS O-acetylase OafA/YrhL
MARPPFDTAHSAQAFVSNLLLLQSFGLHGQLTWNAPAWSIATEFWCYVLFAFAVAAVGKRIERWMVVTVLVCPLILYAATPYGINVTYDWGIVRSIYGFALGVLCWAAWQRIGTRLRGGALVWTLAEMGLVAGIVSFVIGAAGSRANLLGPVLFAAAVLMFAHAGGAVSRFLGLRPWLFIGALSYSIYMVHTLVLSLMVAVVKVFDHMTGMPHALSGHGNVLGNSALQQGLWFAVMFEIVIGVSWLTWTFVERPVQRWSRRIAPSIG